MQRPGMYARFRKGFLSQMDTRINFLTNMLSLLQLETGIRAQSAAVRLYSRQRTSPPSTGLPPSASLFAHPGIIVQSHFTMPS